MTALIVSILAVVCNSFAVLPVESQLITSPPKLELESKPIVWYQISSGGSAQKFELLCHASGDPEKYEWYKNGQPLTIDNARIKWLRERQSGSIEFVRPEATDQGFYQCRAINIFGVAVSNIFEVRLGALNHFLTVPVSKVVVEQGVSLTLPCKKPYGVPEPSIFWLFRNIKETFVIESINKPHITVDGDGSLQFSYVDVHDGRQNLVYQCAATSPVLHGEYRAGDEYRLVVVPATLKPRPPKKLWFSPSVVKVVAHEPLRLTCIFEGYPLPEVKWSKHRSSLPKQRMTFENFGKTLIIKPVFPSDKGMYMCESGDVQHRMLVEITTSPQWIEGPPTNLDVPEESSVELNCSATGDPVPIVRWYKDGKPIGKIRHHSRTKVLHSGKILKISNLHHKTDRGVYQCNASNPLGYVFANAFLNVRAHAPAFDTPIDQTIKAVLSSTIELDCSVQAAPLPFVYWIDESNRKVKEIGGKLEILKNHSIRLYSLTLSDSGVYYCNVSNKYGINKARRQLEVYTPTSLHTALRPKFLTLETGDELELNCKAIADIRLDIRYMWFRDDIIINFGADNLIRRNPEHNQLKITSAKGRHSGVYKCLAQTDVDEVSSEMKLIVKDVPESPTVIEVDCKETHAVIKWLAAYDNHAKIKYYFVDYNTGFQPHIWKPAATVVRIFYFKFSSSIVIHLLFLFWADMTNDSGAFEATVRLSPWVNYTFRVSAENVYGRGAPGILSGATCMTAPSFPYDNPANVTAAGTIRDNLIIRWNPMPKELWNAPGLYYIVRYQPEKSEFGEDYWHERRIEDPFLDHTEIRDLPIFKRFRVQVKAFNSMGESLEEPKTIIGYSGEDLPYVAPKNFRYKALNATNVKFAWDPVDETLMNGHLRGYKIRSWLVSPDDHRSLSLLPEVVVYKLPTFADVDHFEPMNSYAAQIHALNSVFEGPASDVIEFYTPEGTPDHVENLSAESYGAQTILVRWLPPIRIRGYLKLYHIEYFEKDIVYVNDGNDTVAEEIVASAYHAAVPVGTTHHLNEIAKPATEYVVFVWAETGGGPGPNVSLKITTWNETYPAKPSFTIDPINVTSVLITWIPNKTTLPGTCFNVNFTRFNSPIWRTSVTECIPKNTTFIHDLIPNVDYKFVVYSKDGKDGLRSTVSDVKYLRLALNKTAPELSSKNSEANFSGAAWFIAIICAVAVSLLSVVVICICHRNRGGKYPVKKKEIERGECSEKDEKQFFSEYGSGSSDFYTKG